MTAPWKDDFYLRLIEKDTDFRSKIIEAGFPKEIVENKGDAADIFYIVGADGEEFSAENYNCSNILCIGGRHENVKKIIEKNPSADVLAFKNEDACLYFLYNIAAEGAFGMFKEFDLFELYSEFLSVQNNIKIIDCIDFDRLTDLPNGITVFSINSVSEEVKPDDMLKMEEKIAEKFSDSSCISFTMPQNVILYRKILFVSSRK